MWSKTDFKHPEESHWKIEIECEKRDYISQHFSTMPQKEGEKGQTKDIEEQNTGVYIKKEENDEWGTRGSWIVTT